MDRRVIAPGGTSSRAIGALPAGETADMGDGETSRWRRTGYRLDRADDQISGRGQRIFVTATVPPDFTTDNYRHDAVLG
jgi:alpha-glucoside transport system permease protein